jgi:hypothetical protein
MEGLIAGLSLTSRPNNSVHGETMIAFLIWSVVADGRQKRGDAYSVAEELLIAVGLHYVL